MTLRPWQETGRERLARLKVFDVYEATRISPRTGEEHHFFLVDTWDWVNIVAFNEDRELILVRQYRHGPCEFTVEIPGGVIEPSEDPERTAARELREETGYEARELTRIGTVNPNPALFSNRCHTYLALGCRKVGEIEQDRGEDLEVLTMSLGDVEDAVRRGEIDHSLVLSGLYFLRLREGLPR